MGNDINQVAISGNLTKDPELKHISSGTAVCTVNIASNRAYKQGDELKKDVVFLKCQVWGRQGEACGEYLKKGMPVLFSGRLKTNTWEKEGKKNYELVLIVEQVKFLITPVKKSETWTETGTRTETESDLPF